MLVYQRVPPGIPWQSPRALCDASRQRDAILQGQHQRWRLWAWEPKLSTSGEEGSVWKLDVPPKIANDFRHDFKFRENESTGFLGTLFSGEPIYDYN